MPPRLQIFARASRPIACAAEQPSIAAFLQPFLQPFLQRAQQCRSASILSSLSDNDGAYNRRIRRGRGASSGKGKTSGRGHKGQKQHGKVPTGFNGGQTPDEVVSGVRGFTNNFSIEMSPLNVDRIQSWIDAGRLNPAQPITIKELSASRCLHGIKDGVKLLARNATALTTPVNIVVSRASTAAIAAVEKAGGSVTTRYYSKPSIRRVLQGLSDPINSIQSKPISLAEMEQEAAAGALRTTTDFKFRLPDATSRKDIEYYRDPAHRGYLSHLVGEGQGPSLFFKTPGAGRADRKKVTLKGGKSVVKGENRIW